MKKILSFLLPVGLVYGLWTFSKAGTAASTLLVDVNNAKLGKGIELKFRNSGSYTFTLDLAYLDIYINNGKIATVEKNWKPPFQIKEKEISTVYVPLTTNALTILMSIPGILTGGGKIRVRGYVRVNDKQIPVDKTISLTA